MPLELWVIVIPSAFSLFASIFGTYVNGKVIEVRLKELEKKMDKHNNLVERMVRVEDSTKSAHKRLDNLGEKRC